MSSETTQYRNSRAHVETILRQRLRGLRRVSYQLLCFNSILECAFEDSGDNACVPRQLAQLLGVPFEEVCGDFDALAEHDCGARAASRRWRYEPSARGATRSWSSSPTQASPWTASSPRRETKTVVFTYYDGHAFFYRNARPVLEQMGCALVMYRRDPKQTVPPLEEWSPWLGDGTLRPIHDCVLGFEATMVARVRREPPKYIKQVKTDCVVLQGMPRKFRDNLERLVHNTYPDGKPKFRHEETTKPL